jgi:hypothetical protein
MQAPHETLPTLALFPTHQPAVKQTTVVSPPPLPSPNSISSGTVKEGSEFRALDEDSRKRILDYIYDTCDGSVTGERTRQETELKRGTGGHAMSSFVPSMQRREKPASSDVFDMLADRLKLTTKSNLLRVDKPLLIEHGLTVRILVEQCRVKISDLYFAGIVTTFQDLVQLGFTPEDLKRDRILFNCQMLKERYLVNASALERAGIDFNVVREPHFYPQELMVMEFSLGEQIDQGFISRDALRCLNYAMADLVALGFSKHHLKKLKITKAMATDAQPNGFGWTDQDMHLLT